LIFKLFPIEESRQLIPIFSTWQRGRKVNKDIPRNDTIFQLIVFKRLLKMINILVFAGIIILICFGLVIRIGHFNMYKSDFQASTITLIILMPLSYYLVRYLFLSYSILKDNIIVPIRLNEYYFILSLIIPFMNMILPILYFRAMIEGYGIKGWNRRLVEVFIFSFIANNTYGSLAILIPKLYGIEYAELGRLSLTLIIGGIMSILGLVSLNLLFRGQSQCLRKRYSIREMID
jgi:hypothetical protein